MTYTEQEARRLIIEAGHRLLASGLVTRTWGNISARVSSTHFIITPSGLSYDTLQPEQLVLVKIDDCSHKGEYEPSSEKGIHAAAYRLRPDIGFVIHTHQDYASVLGIGGQDLTAPSHPALGCIVPAAAYGLPGTKKLQKNVVSAMLRAPRCRAFLMKHHGTLCLGQDPQRAFEIADALENTCRTLFEQTVTIPTTESEAVTGLIHELSIAATGQYFSIESHPAVLAVAARGKTLRPALDDMAQILGTTVRCAKNDVTAIMSAMKGQNAVLVPGIGGVCMAGKKSDLHAMESLLRKGCMAALYAETCGAKPIRWFDCLLMRLVYQIKYSRKKAGNCHAEKTD